MDDPPADMRPGRPQGRAGCSPRQVGSLETRTPSARNPSPAPANRSLSGAGGDPRLRSSEHSDCESWVREKVLFLLHPERWLGTQGDPGSASQAGAEDLVPVTGDLHHQHPELRTSHRRIAVAREAQPRDPPAPPRSVLVRVEDYHVTQEVQQTSWTRGLMTKRTEERSVTAVTFRAPRE
uniref:RIKEN cDNA 9130008F23 gene n=1 Tax=Nannospalax galili TaxID=1026970 RepID=A0A8C6W764_NANGA